MKPEKINQLIAEHCGWTCFGLWNGNPTQIAAYPPNGKVSCIIPNYCNDLNAIAGAIKEVILGNADLERAFIKHLNAILDRRADDEAGPVICEYEMAQITADAEEFCEALLRTVGKWEEE